MIKVLIVGDDFMDPELFKNRIEERYRDNVFDISTMYYHYPVDAFPLKPGTVVPSGMSWENPEGKKEQYGVREYYGDPLALMNKLDDTEILIIHGCALPRQVIMAALKLHMVIALRGGPINLDRECLTERGIKLLNTNGKNAEAVAEFVLASLLSFERNVCKGNKGLIEDVWTPGLIRYDRVGVELRRRTFGFVGYGRIARCLRELLQGFHCRVLVYDPLLSPENMEGVEAVTLEELCGEADYISIHARCQAGTSPLINAEMLSYMKKEAVLINTARGSLLDYHALKDSLMNGTIRGAVLDVFGDEEYSFYKELIAMPQVLATPHIAGATKETVLRAVEMALDCLKIFV